MKILRATSEAEIAACYPVFKILRPHLVAEEFVARVQRQQTAGYRLIFIALSGEVVVAAGYRYLEFLAWGRFLLRRRPHHPSGPPRHRSRRRPHGLADQPGPGNGMQ